MGQSERSTLPAETADQLLEAARSLYLEHPDSGVHSAAEWLMQQWQEQVLLGRLEGQLIEIGVVRGKNWYVGQQGHTMAILPRSVEALYGERHRLLVESGGPGKPTLSLTSRIAVATKEVTREQLDRFLGGNTAAETKGLAACGVAINEARQYCNWLSRLAELPDGELCYETDDAGNVIPFAEFQNKLGYRLPLVTEWHYASQTGAVTRHFFGDSDEHLSAQERQRDSRLLPTGWLLDR